MPEVEKIVDGYRTGALDDMKRASELLCIAQATGRDEDLRRAMMAHENAAQSARHYFYVLDRSGQAAMVPPANRLRMPQQNRIA